jgi:hypothetical protein
MLSQLLFCFAQWMAQGISDHKHGRALVYVSWMSPCKIVIPFIDPLIKIFQQKVFRSQSHERTIVEVSGLNLEISQT